MLLIALHPMWQERLDNGSYNRTNDTRMYQGACLARVFPTLGLNGLALPPGSAVDGLYPEGFFIISYSLYLIMEGMTSGIVHSRYSRLPLYLKGLAIPQNPCAAFPGHEKGSRSVD